MSSIPLFPYGNDQLILHLKNLKNKTDLESFNKVLSNLWNSAVDRGLFRYKIENLPTKILPGKYRFILQLNPDRAQKRRKPQEILHVNQPFNDDEFNFNKIKSEEILLRLLPSTQTQNSEEEHLLLINISPLEFGHVLLTPSRNANRPQSVSPKGLKLALEMALLSQNPDLRLGFNSLCGYASVNHEHFHAYFLPHRLYLESADLKSIACSCHTICDYPAPGFAFVLTDLSEMGGFVKDILKLTEYCQRNELAHNIFITRGSTKYNTMDFDCLRVFLWIRESSYGAKTCDAFNPALCELGGHFPCKNATAYETLTEEFICSLLGEICTEHYHKVLKVIPQILN